MYSCINGKYVSHLLVHWSPLSPNSISHFYTYTTVLTSCIAREVDTPTMTRYVCSNCLHSSSHSLFWSENVGIENGNVGLVTLAFF